MNPYSAHLDLIKALGTLYKKENIARKMNTLPTRATLRAYGAFPADDMRYASVWWELADHINQEYETLERNRTLPLIEIVPQEVPYANIDAMRSDYLRGRLKVSTLNCEHPVFSRETHIRFRVLHDLTHCAFNVGFDEAGEFATYQRQSHGLAQELRSALYTEIVIQASYKIHFGEFPQQKMFLAEEVIR